MAAKPFLDLFLVVCFGILTLPASPARAEQAESWTLSGSFRFRYEALAGQFRPGFAADEQVVSLRTTLFAQYDTGPVRIVAELYDSRAYGGEPGSALSASDVNALELVQAYLASDLPLGRAEASLQAGRFIMKLGTPRFRDEDEYRNTNPGFTGLRADLRSRNRTSATLFFTLPHRRLPEDEPSVLANRVRVDRESFELVYWGGMAGWTRAWRNVSLDALYSRLSERDSPDRPTRDRRLHSLMVRLIRQPAVGKVDFAAEAVLQSGSISAGRSADAARLEVSASYFHADLGYSFRGPLGLRLAAEYDRASGDGPGPRYGRFDPLFGVRRPDLAPTGIYAALGRANVSAPALRADIAPDPRWDGSAIARVLWAEEATDAFSNTGVSDPSGAAGRFAGLHFGARLRWWLVPDRLRAEINAARLVKRGLLVHAPNVPATGDTNYVSATFNARF